MVEYLGYIDDLQSAKTDMERENLELEHRKEPPEAYILMMNCDYPRRLPYPGSWIEQPYILIQELAVCLRAQNEHELIVERNRVLKMSAANGGGLPM